ncbi:MAG: biotin--[acetyl-CoA-carboxylase] ligase [Actinomycetota bacterium]
MSDDLSDGTRDPRALRVGRALSDTGLGPVSWIPETGSTNDDLLAAASVGAAHGRVLVADHQTAGRGRRDRRWESAPGDALMMSVLLVPETGAAGLPVLTTAVGVAAAEACVAVGAEGIGLKWPNDLVVGSAGAHRKLAGILAQSVVSRDRVAAVVGLGLNVRGERLGVLASGAVALDDLVESPDREELLIEILRSLDALLRLPGAELRERYLALSATVGTAVEVTTDAGTLSGSAVDVTIGGALVVEADGAVHEVVVGDVVSVRPDPSG